MKTFSEETGSSKAVFFVCVVASAVLACAVLGVSRHKGFAKDEDLPFSKTAEIERIGGKVGIDGEAEGQPIWMIDLSGTPIDGDFLSILNHFPDVEVLNLGQTPIQDKDLQVVLKLKKLNELDLSGTGITDAAVDQLKKVGTLKVLKLNDTSLTDRGLQKLALITSLEELQFEGTQVTDVARSRFEYERKKVRAMSDATTERAKQLHRQGRLMLIESHGTPSIQDQAVEFLEQAVLLDPGNEQFKLDLADAYLVVDLELTQAAAIDLYEEVLAQHPKDQDLLGRIAKAYSALENTEQAFEYVKRRINVIDPGEAFDVASQVVGIVAAGGSRDIAKGLLDQILKKSPDDLRLQLLVAAMSVESGNKSEARRIIENILMKTPAGHPIREAAEELLRSMEDRS